MAEHINLYQRAVYYDIIFDRDVSDEVAFVIAAFRHYAAREPQSALDVACGPAYHARALARLGIRVVGLDLRPEMTTLAQEKDRAAGVSVELIAADMRDFDLLEPVDVAFIMFDGIDALLTNEDIIQHYQAVARNLTPGGLYIIDLTHPRDCSFGDYGEFRYTGERDGTKVEIIWATNNPAFDLISSIATVELEMNINDHGKEIRIKDSAQERLLLPQEIRFLAKLSEGLEVVGWYGDFNLAQPFDDSPNSRRMITVLQKTGGG